MNLLDAQAEARRIAMIPAGETETRKKLDTLIRDAMEAAYNEGYGHGLAEDGVAS